MTRACARLRDLLAQKALILGEVQLSRGGTANYYFDCKRVTLDGEGASLVGDAVVDAIASLDPPALAVGGLTLGADPIVSAAIVRAHSRGVALSGFYVRKEPKKHGTQQYIENAPPPGTRVVIVDDAVTTGGATLDALTRAEQAGLAIAAVVSLVDREAGGAANIRARCANYIPIFTLSDFPEIPDAG
ncbi:orotate phosphoribosyltransferase [bacterium]|nr:orotate phosphoribosyltransferase [bacterium]